MYKYETVIYLIVYDVFSSIYNNQIMSYCLEFYLHFHLLSYFVSYFFLIHFFTYYINYLPSRFFSLLYATTQIDVNNIFVHLKSKNIGILNHLDGSPKV